MQQANDMPLLLPCSTATAAALGVTRAQLYRLAHIEGLAVKLGGRLYLKRDVLMAYLGLNTDGT